MAAGSPPRACGRSHVTHGQHQAVWPDPGGLAARAGAGTFLSAGSASTLSGLSTARRHPVHLIVLQLHKVLDSANDVATASILRMSGNRRSLGMA